MAKGTFTYELKVKGAEGLQIIKDALATLAVAYRISDEDVQDFNKVFGANIEVVEAKEEIVNEA